MNCIVTGASGFVGSHLVEFLVGQGLTVYGLDKRVDSFPGSLAGDLKLISCDILDRAAVNEAVTSIRPDYVFHLAAQSLPRISWEQPEATFNTNVIGTMVLLEAIRAAHLDPVIEMFCSSAEYAAAQDGQPIREDHPLEPGSPYALSKIAQDHLSVLYGTAYHMRIVRVRPFFVIGPRKTGDVSSDVARRIVAIEGGTATKLRVGNLEPVRDFLDVRDAVKAFYLVLHRGAPGEVYNVCSGTGHSVQEIVTQLTSLSKNPVEIESDTSLLRPVDESIRIGDNSKLCSLGWSPMISLQESLESILESCRDDPGEHLPA